MGIDRSRLRRAPGVCLGAMLILVSSSSAAQTDYPDSRTPSRSARTDEARTSDGPRRPPPRDSGDRDDSGSTALWVGGAVVAGGLIAALASGKKGPSGDELLANGPSLPGSFEVGSFPIHGFFKNGWPVVVDFLPTPNSVTWLEVSSRRRPKEPLSIILDRNGREGRRLIKVNLPNEGPAPSVQAGKYVVRSAILLNGQIARRRNGEQVPAPIEVYGIGGGPRAVGSVAIDALRISPARLRPGQTSAAYAYRVRSPFNRTSAEIVRFTVDGDKIRTDRVAETARNNIFPGEQSGGWDGMIAGRRKPSIGVHRLQVRGWFTADDRSWVGAMSPMLVNVAE